MSPSPGPRARPADSSTRRGGHLGGAAARRASPGPLPGPSRTPGAAAGRGARSSGTRAHRARPQRRRRYLTRDGRRRRGTAALRLGLYGGGLGPFRRCPQPPSAFSGAFFGNLRRGQSVLGNLRSEPLRVFPATYRRTVTRAISGASPQPFRPPSDALPFPRQFPSLFSPNSGNFRCASGAGCGDSTMLQKPCDVANLPRLYSQPRFYYFDAFPHLWCLVRCTSCAAAADP